MIFICFDLIFILIEKIEEKEALFYMEECDYNADNAFKQCQEVKKWNTFIQSICVCTCITNRNRM